MPAMTMTNKVYQALEQAAHMTGAAKNPILEDTLSRYLVEFQEDAEDAACADTLRQRANCFHGSTNRYKVESKNI